MTWRVILSKQAVKDTKKLKEAGLKPQAEKLLQLLTENPFKMPPAYEKLVGNLKGFYSRRINIQHRLIYDVDNREKIIHVLRMWTHYE
ncbi:MAG: Txe/YoeB family addiction module toxin [Desulfobacteraceae bacterium]|nr:Txe/YoeB family addiction module toxin [Desulfobacteraceae bacterium]MBC2757645.1 Txe/YoeB family addiction module toxin [Desulfobacteraceae bacterium]MBC2763890.1 Txe/YoeB family addiction module toxin [ANME-2 cluster archaeon]